MKKSVFSLIEIALAMGVAFLAFTVLIAFFPTSFKRIQNSQSSSYAATVAQDFVTKLKRTLTVYPVPEKIVDTVDDSTTPYTYRYKTITGPKNDYNDYLADWKASFEQLDSVSWDTDPCKVRKDDFHALGTEYPSLGATPEEGTHFTQHPTHKSLWLIRNVTHLDGDVAVVDHTIEARVWKSPFLNSNALFQKSTDNVSLYYNDDYSVNVRLNIELSWPITELYAPATDKRKRFFYSVDLVK